MTTTRRTVLKGIGAGTALLVAPVGASSAEEDEAGLRVAHASPDAPAVDVLVDGTAEVEGLEFRSVTDYLELEAGEYDLAVNVAGTDTTVFSAEAVDLAAEDYTAVALGEVESDDTDFTVGLFEDTNGANLDDEFRLRAIHASPDAPAVDVTVDDDDLTLFEDVAFGESSGYTTAPADEYEVEIRPAGGGDPVFEADVSFEAGSTYTAFAVGYLTPDDEDADEAFGLVPSEDRSAPPRGDGNGRGDDKGNAGGNGKGRGR
ncbi:MAG: DUF4397 domain-containing protein [Haloferacaceae archaeon]